jgi:hypothetical protein
MVVTTADPSAEALGYLSLSPLRGHKQELLQQSCVLAN